MEERVRIFCEECQVATFYPSGNIALRLCHNCWHAIPIVYGVDEPEEIAKLLEALRNGDSLQK